MLYMLFIIIINLFPEDSYHHNWKSLNSYSYKSSYLLTVYVVNNWKFFLFVSTTSFIINDLRLCSH